MICQLLIPDVKGFMVSKQQLIVWAYFETYMYDLYMYDLYMYDLYMYDYYMSEMTILSVRKNYARWLSA